jgi:hypothetical protein
MSVTTHPQVNYKTIKLSKGKHHSPEDGACVMELASMLAGEPFSDRPQSVCPVIGAVLRHYNDSLDDRRRQDLYGCASQVLGTRSCSSVERERIARCAEFVSDLRASHSRLRRALRPRRIQTGPIAESEAAGRAIVATIGRHSDRTHALMLRLIDELCDIGRPGQAHADQRWHSISSRPIDIAR